MLFLPDRPVGSTAQSKTKQPPESLIPRWLLKPTGGRIRQLHAAPKVDNSALADAIRYGVTRLRRLQPYLDDGRLAIDNNAGEWGMRGIAEHKINRTDELFPRLYHQRGV